MKIKVATNDENYKQVVLKRAIIICWVLLAICFVIKLFGGNFFNIICEYENFARFCNFIDNHIIGKVIIGFISTSILEYLYICSVYRNLIKNKLHIIIIAISSLLSVICRNLIALKFIPYLFDLWLYIGLPIIIQVKDIKIKVLLDILISFVFVFLSQFVSVFIKSVGINNYTGKSTFVLMILSIDIYIMCALLCLYRLSKKEK